MAVASDNASRCPASSTATRHWAAEVPRAEGATARSVGGAVTESEVPERDLSVQLSGWMLMEAAARLR